MMSFAAERLMVLEVAARTKTGHDKRNPSQQPQDKGYRDRDWEI